MAESRADQPSVRTGNGHDRLESWKEIAGYLKRDVRTVQRWEKREGLPVHRHLHDKLGTVYAHPEELDAWWGSRRVALDQTPAEAAAEDLVDGLPAAGDESSNGALVPAMDREALPAPAAVPRRTWSWMAIWLPALLCAGLVGFAAWRYLGSRPATVHEAGPALHQLGVLDAAFVRVSPDARWVAYIDEPAQHLRIRGVDGSGDRVLVADPVRSPFAWSKDGARIAFLTVRPDTFGRLLFNLEVVVVGDGKRTTLWQGAENGMVEPQDWSPDGRRLLCRVRPGAGRVQMAFLSLADRSLETLQTLPSAMSFQVSPDGRFIAYSARRDGNWELFLFAIAQKQEIRLTQNPARDFRPFWTPDGRHIVFLRQRGSSARMWALPIDPSTGTARAEAVMIPTPSNRSFPVALSSTGQLFFTRRQRSPQIYVLDVNPQTGRALSSPRSSFEDETFEPSWSADGKRLFFRKVLPNGVSLLTERNIATGDEVALRPPQSHEVAFFVHASGPDDAVAFLGWNDREQGGFFEYRAKAEQVAPLWTVDETALAPATWSPDGKKLLFSTLPLRDGRFPIRVAVRGREETSIVAYSRSRPFPRWSPDGRAIAYTDRHCLMVVPVSGGDARQVTCAQPSLVPSYAQFTVGSLGWSSDGRRIAWTQHNEAERQIELWLVDARTGTRTVAWAGEKNYGAWPSEPAWSPDGTKIAFRMDHRPQTEVWNLSGFLPGM